MAALGNGIPGVRGGAIVATDKQTLDSISGLNNTDAALVARTQQGDVGAFGDLVSRYQRAVYAVVSRMVDDRDDVDDIVQEVFVLAYKSIRSFRGDAAFSTWVHRIAINTAIKQMKKIKTRRAPSIDDPLTGLGDGLMSSESERPERVAEHNARNEALKQAIDELPDKHRVVVILHYFQNLSCDEIAKITECSVGTVWSRLHYACKKLQGQLGWLTPEC